MLSQLRFTLFTSLLLMGLLLSISSLVASERSTEKGSALLLTVKGAITPATLDYLKSGLNKAEQAGSELLILQLDTPGGLDSSTREIISKIINSSIPIATWVAPDGARAASAGTYILLGSHVAAMSPSTHLGSATPVAMGGGLPGQEDEANEDTGDADEEPRSSSAMERKVLEDAVSYIRNLADRHGRNADWAEKAVRDADNLTAQEALEKNVIDLVAANRDALLTAMHGQKVVMADGERLELATADLRIEEYQPNWRTRLLAIITDPTVAYFLMIIGFYGLVFELSNPGSLFPGILGALSLLLALYAFQVLPINFAGLALIFLGIALIIAEAFVPSFGILGVGGIVAFVSGSVLLMESSQLAVSLPLIGGTAIIAAGFLLWAVTRFMGLRQRRPTIGQEAAPGESCIALEDFSTKGRVRFHGEIWTAELVEPHQQVTQAQELKVVQVQGLTLLVKPQTHSTPKPSSAT